MQETLIDFSDTSLIKKAINTNWENYHFCLGRSSSVELSVGRYLTWLITKIPDHFMNLVVCTQLPAEGAGHVIDEALEHFRSLNVKKLTWLAREGVPSIELKKCLLARGLTFHESYSTDMAVDLTTMPNNLSFPGRLAIVPVQTEETLKQWIHVASIGFGMAEEYEKVWFDFFADAVYDLPFRNYLACWDGKPVATSQLFLSAGVAGIYNVTCIPEARGQGIGTAITQFPLLHARRMGYRIGILQASELGYPVYKKLGFQDYGKLSVYLWEN